MCLDIKKDDFIQQISKYIKKDKINHAYLLETNYTNKIELARALSNHILSLKDRIDISNLEKNYDFTIISSDSNTIKTEEIEKLKEMYKTKSINGNVRIYVIDGAEKLNEFAANKLLKFLEEPEEKIIAILLTDNKNSVLNTIVSRCQILRYIVKENRFKDYDIDYINSLFEFIFNIEENNEKAIAYQNRIDIKKLSDRKYLQEFLENLIYIYGDILTYKIKKESELSKDYEKKIKIINDNNDFIKIQNKINSINEAILRLKYNPNIKLFIDKLIIMMSGVDTNV
ncbi:MAG: hypothetical protein IJ568_02890 [Bacilli bacterium]|nr:hypothetical protein [Bacilli bacterium]